MARQDERAPATWNKHLSALRSFAAYAIRNEWITADPARHLERRKITQCGDQAVPRARLEALFTDDRNALRERVLWRLLYEGASPHKVKTHIQWIMNRSFPWSRPGAVC
ncbi:hypothetical protein [Streptosporangium canum]|uniref:hypothetical protein n=1 Tax=Streptosporangium canum TaxID=324952 RepID=UPI00378845B1